MEQEKKKSATLIKKQTLPPIKKEPVVKESVKKVVVLKKKKKVVIKKENKKEIERPTLEVKPADIIVEHKPPVERKTPEKTEEKKVKTRIYKKQLPEEKKKSDADRSTKDKGFSKKVKKKGAYASKKRQEEQQHEKELNLKKKDKNTPTISKSPVPKEIAITEVITVGDLAKKMNLKASVLISKLVEMGEMVRITDTIDSDTAEILANEFHCKVNVVSLFDETIIEAEVDRPEDMKSRSPIVTVMGHVDHGKTKLLDAIRSTNVVDGEHGGITQHIGAYQVKLKDGEHITFIDTPGHEAFTAMRARGAKVTDIVILVVAADDGVMPQTIEAINHAKAAEVPIIVAINKIDLVDANPERIMKQLSSYDLIPEEWSGNTMYCPVSALKRQGIEHLLESIMLQAEVMELKANYACRAIGRVLESEVDIGRGIIATIVIEKGVLKIGESFVAGIYHGRIRAMFDDRGHRIKKGGPSTPVEILGLTGVPDAGDPFQVTESEKVAKQISAKRQELKRLEDSENVKKLTLDDLYERIQQGDVQELKIIIKGDVQGSAEALKEALERLSTPEVKLICIHASAGAINKPDIMLASASNAIIVGFHVRPSILALELAEKEKVEIRRYNIIYDAINDIKASMEGLLKPELQEQFLGSAEIKETFKISKLGTIAGCIVTDGKIQRNSLTRIIRDSVEIHSGKISSLKRFKDDAKEVQTGMECGIGIENYNNLKIGDIIEAYEIKEIARTID